MPCDMPIFFLFAQNGQIREDLPMPKKFENEWILDDLKDHPSFKTKSMFGGLAVYIFGKQVFVIVEPTKSGRWDWHGVLVCTDHCHHESLGKEFRGLLPHEAIKKWLFIESKSEHFEDSITKITQRITANDERIGIFPKLK